ncbi:TadE/TadG family type IV pilus assembly protein [Paenibacillus xerothermodurans]|uniref:Pilus assembly protein n=1 Tax=Paenibacillus xerothermodurans TaxID=1977292 RepID=A0A2W1NQQ2_PAEXE|nr:TadE/TadG family type IV pilus assembly protein [Paenibacillus xerothermodurans]PZE21815.1 pilus assembly protein [Paenibacillus xerothermodurans]
MKIIRDDEGGIVLEAALVLPLFLSFILMLIAFIQISLAEMALQSAVSETTKVLAVNMYPVDLLYAQAKNQWDQSAVSVWLDQAIGRVKAVNQTAADTEQFVQDYEQWIPEPLVKVMGWEKTHRQQLEALSQSGTEEAKKQVRDAYQPILNSTFAPLVGVYANKTRLNMDRLKVTNVILPDLNNTEEAFVGVEAQYELPLHVPFFRKTVIIRKKAYERAWVGAAG